MRWPSLLFAFMLASGAARAEAVTVRDIIELSKTGLSDEILIAVIEVERKVFPIDSDTLKLLKDAGVSDRVIIAMVRSGRAQVPLPEPVVEETAAPAPPPQVVVIERPVHEVTEVRQVMVPVPVYVPVVTHPRRQVDHVGDQHIVVPSTTVPFSTIGLPHAPMSLPPPRRRSDPPYWWEIQQPRKDHR
jgi:hypothetical protein